MSIDREVHAVVLDLIRRLLDRHPRTLAEEEYLNMLQSVADDYERDFPEYAPLLTAKGKLLSGGIGGVAWLLVRASDLLGEVFARLVELRFKYPYATLLDVFPAV